MIVKQAKPKYIPMPADEKRKLQKDFEDHIKPVLQRQTTSLIEQALQPLKTVLAVVQKDFKAEMKRTLDIVNANNLSKDKEMEEFKRTTTEMLETEMHNLVVKLARFKSDNDVRFNKVQTDIDENNALIQSQSNSFDELAGVMAMLIENLAMQMEAEAQDLVDRR